MAHWYAVYTKPRKEMQVESYLQSRGIETYLPALQVPSTRHLHATRREPFLARYLFADLDLLRLPLSSVNWAPGVTGVVSFGGQPARVPDDVIQCLKDRLAQMDAGDPSKGLSWRPNDRVRIVAGPLKGMEAIFDQRLSSHERARVFIDLLGRLTACEIDITYLKRA